MITLAGDTSLAAFIEEFFTGEVVGGRRDPGKRLTHEPEVSSSSIVIVCSAYKITNHIKLRDFENIEFSVAYVCIYIWFPLQRDLLQQSEIRIKVLFHCGMSKKESTI